MVFIEWNNLRRLVKEINNNPFLKDRLAWDDGQPLIPGNSRSLIYKDLKEIIAKLVKLYPDDWERGLPGKIVEWFREERESGFILSSGKRNHFVMFPYWMVDSDFLKKGPDGAIGALTGQELAVLMVFARYASFAQGVNEKGCRYGETFLSNKKAAEILGLSESSVDRLTASLSRKGQLETVHQAYDGRQNKCIRAVRFMSARRDGEGNDDS